MKYLLQKNASIINTRKYKQQFNLFYSEYTIFIGSDKNDKIPQNSLFSSEKTQRIFFIVQTNAKFMQIREIIFYYS